MKYYVGVKKDSAWLFRSNVEPTAENHPDNILFCWGGYSTRKKAEQVAMYQNYLIDNDRHQPIPIW